MSNPVKPYDPSKLPKDAIDAMVRRIEQQTRPWWQVTDGLEVPTRVTERYVDGGVCALCRQPFKRLAGSRRAVCFDPDCVNRFLEESAWSPRVTAP